MKLSIITVNWNNLAGLQLTMQSVLEQDYNQFEYIVVDGASNDGSKELIEKFAGQFEAVSFRWISEPDNGVFEAMNKGIRMATGDYLLFLNSGDTFVSSEVLKQIFSQVPEITDDILVGQCNIVDKTSIIHTVKVSRHPTLQFFLQSTFPHQATFIRKNLFERYGFYREDFKLASDWEFWIRTVILQGIRIELLPIVISNYNLDGMSSQEKNQQLIAAEKKQAFKDLHLDRIVPDYDWYANRSKQLAPYLWLDKFKLVQHCVNSLYKLVQKIKN